MRHNLSHAAPRTSMERMPLRFFNVRVARPQLRAFSGEIRPGSSKGMRQIERIGETKPATQAVFANPANEFRHQRPLEGVRNSRRGDAAP